MGPLARIPGTLLEGFAYAGVALGGERFEEEAIGPAQGDRRVLGPGEVAQVGDGVHEEARAAA
ncbi:hypothetical protein D3C86_2155500 [compost metagenome]